MTKIYKYLEAVVNFESPVFHREGISILLQGFKRNCSKCIHYKQVALIFNISKNSASKPSIMKYFHCYIFCINWEAFIENKTYSYNKKNIKIIINIQFLFSVISQYILCSSWVNNL